MAKNNNTDKRIVKLEKRVSRLSKKKAPKRRRKYLFDIKFKKKKQGGKIERKGRKIYLF